jgi:UDP-glucose 4-epimerase
MSVQNFDRVELTAGRKEYASSRVLITGGAGFIGSNLARRLVEYGAQVTIVDSLIPQYGGNLFNLAGVRDRVQLNISDVRDRHAMAFLVREQDILFNLAGQTSHIDSMDDPQSDLEINATAQLSLLESCRRVNPAIKIVFASTRQIYGRPLYLPVDDKHPIRPIDVNGINKTAGEWYHLLYNDVHGLRACALRLTNTYGPGMRVKDARQTFLGVWIRCLLEGEPFEIYGDGSQLRDFNYVDDCVNALLLAGTSERANGKAYTLGSRQVVSLKQLADLLTKLVPSSRYRLVPFPPERKAIDIGDYYGDFSRITAELGWSPAMELQEGLARTIEYYRQHRHEYW